MKADGLRNAVYENLARMRGGTLTFWGDWFGKPYDNIHNIVGAGGFGGTAVLFFDQGESLIIEEPDEWSFERGAFLVRAARVVRFQWFYYGRLPSRESLQFVEYRRDGADIQFATDFMPDFRPETLHPTIDPTAPAVQLHHLPN